jgi:aspartate-semialdehyde dehydrogenase
MITIGIIGVNGLVGKAILKSINMLNLYDNIKYKYYFYGTQKSTMIYNNETVIINKFENEYLNKLNYVILATDNQSAKNIYIYIFTNKLDITVIDNSSEFRLYEHVPLCIPEINSKDLDTYKEKKTKFISNPNCVTTLLCMILKPLLNLANIKRIIASTYQAASGAGYKGLEELEKQTKEYYNSDNLTMDFWGKQYIFNVFSHNTDINKDNLFNSEELKLVNETKKILNINPKITATCVRVPTITSHCISVNIEFDKELDKKDILNELEKFPGVKILDDIDNNKFPEPIITSNKPDIYVGRIRSDIDDKKCWNFFISGDQLLKGAGYNSVQILKYLI